MTMLTQCLIVARRAKAPPPPAGFLHRCAAALGEVEPKTWLKIIGGVAAVTCTGYVGYKTYQGCAAAGKAVRRWWRGPLEMAPAPQVSTIDGAVGSFRSESAMPGSEEVPLTPPKCQAIVGYEESNKFYVVGNATRIDQWLVIPDHVRAAAAAKPLELRLVSDGKSAGYVLDAEFFDSLQVIDTDILATQMSDAAFSRIGLAKVGVTPSLDENHGAFVQICGPYGRGTTGNLSHHQIFGKTIYTGSTFEGYSGAAYMAGRHLAAIHLHGGAFNGGYSASYLMAMLKHIYKIKDEETSEWLNTYVKDKRNVTWDNSYLDDEDVRVRIAGRYHVLKRDSMARVWGKDWARSIGRENWRTKPHYEDYECVKQGEAPRQHISGGSEVLAKSPPSVEELVARQDWKGLQSYACARHKQALQNASLAGLPSSSAN